MLAECRNTFNASLTRPRALRLRQALFALEDASFPDYASRRNRLVHARKINMRVGVFTLTWPRAKPVVMLEGRIHGFDSATH